MIMVRIVMNAIPEKQKEVLQTLLSINDPREEDCGCLSYGIYCDIKDRNVFNLISEWETRRHLDDHMKSDSFSVLLGTKSLLFEPLDFKICTVSGSEGIEAVTSARNRETDIACH